MGFKNGLKAVLIQVLAMIDARTGNSQLAKYKQSTGKTQTAD